MTRPTALVTGASSGIGLAFARRLAADGYDLVLVARREGRLKELADELNTAHGAATEVLVADLTDADDLARVESRLIDPQRPVELLVNNAGFGTMGRFSEAVREELRGSGVRVMALCPGFTRTEFQDTANAQASSLPSVLWQSAEQVADIALRDLRRGVTISVPGVHNKVAALFSQLSPRSLTRRVSGMVGRRLQQ